jgi:hypothetical protein
MKKLAIVVMVLALFLGGCAWSKTQICSPTAEQAMSYAQQIAQASDALLYFQSLVPSVPLAAIIAGLKLAVATLQQAKDGVCLTPEQIATAQSAVQNAGMLALQLKMGKSMTLVGK